MGAKTCQVPGETLVCAIHNEKATVVFILEMVSFNILSAAEFYLKWHHLYAKKLPSNSIVETKIQFAQMDAGFLYVNASTVQKVHCSFQILKFDLK